MRALQSFHSNFAARFDFLQQCWQSFCPAQLLTPDNLFATTNPVHLKDTLGEINADADNSHGGSFLQLVVSYFSLGAQAPIDEEESIPLLLAEAGVQLVYDNRCLCRNSGIVQTVFH
jgi:hypothetical protein